MVGDYTQGGEQTPKSTKLCVGEQPVGSTDDNWCTLQSITAHTQGIPPRQTEKKNFRAQQALESKKVVQGFLGA